MGLGCARLDRIPFSRLGKPTRISVSRLEEFDIPAGRTATLLPGQGRLARRCKAWRVPEWRAPGVPRACQCDAALFPLWSSGQIT